MTGALVFLGIVCCIGFLAFAVFHGRHINLVVALLFLASCRHEVKVGVPVNRPQLGYIYVATEHSNVTRYTVIAKTKAALDAALLEIGCVSTPCSVGRAADVFIVERWKVED